MVWDGRSTADGTGDVPRLEVDGAAEVLRARGMHVVMRAEKLHGARLVAELTDATRVLSGCDDRDGRHRPQPAVAVRSARGGCAEPTLNGREDRRGPLEDETEGVEGKSPAFAQHVDRRSRAGRVLRE